MDQARVRETENLPTQPLSVVVAIATIFTDLSYIATVKEKAAANVTVFLWGHLHSCSEVCVFTVRPSVREPVTIKLNIRSPFTYQALNGDLSSLSLSLAPVQPRTTRSAGERRQ